MRNTTNIFPLIRGIIGIVFGFIEVSLLFRFLFKLFGANRSAAFVDWLYQTTDSLVAPFTRIFPAPGLEGPFTFEFGAIFALIVYLIINFALIELMVLFENWSTNRDKGKAKK